MTRLLTLAALTAGLFAASAPSAQAQYRSSTASLGGSCQNIQTLQTGYVTAECRDDQGRYRWSSIYAPQCRSDLINRNGVLACQGVTGSAGGYVDQPTTQGSTAASVIGAIAQALLGGEADPADTNPVWGQPGYGDPASGPSYGTPDWGYGNNGQWIPIASRQTWLETRLDAGQRDRRLSNQEASRLRSEFQAIVRLEAQYRRGGLTSSEQADLDRRFNALSARLPAEAQDGSYGWGGVSARQAEIEAQIDGALRARSLTTRDAARLRAEFQQIVRLESQYRTNGISRAEQADLDRRLEALRARIPGQTDQYGWRGMSQRQAEVDARIDTALRDRALTVRDAAQLRAEFQEIVRLEAQYRQGGLSAAEQNELDRRFAVLSARIPSQGPYGQNDPYGGYGWTSISQRGPQFEARIDAGLRNRTLNSWDAARLRAEFNEIARLEGQYSQGGLSSAEQADLDRRFEALSARLPGADPY
ncbi:hypothetical protein [Phenylobacterium sp.]|jgi:hypothetical protein|uniref:hypothetical protein n=1 Tax=Phenylobacterium sp. TaxID=1871053 RepID=UPI0025F9F11C|nr:hypothetical protein [Phenylobacterium sp.]|tara:strand:- start:7529 stop:8953 length:1425 start_codon:yes stop_codon:yes gene_type:complete